MNTINNEQVTIDSSYEDKQFFPHLMDNIVRFYTYSAVIGLVFYMLSTLWQSFYIALKSIMDISNNPDLLGRDMLHTVAFTIVLVKAYKVLMEYARTQHVNIKFIIEIAIIAPVIELLFNFDTSELKQMYFLWVFSAVMTLYYLFFYKTIAQVDKDYRKEHEKEYQKQLEKLRKYKQNKPKKK